MSRRGSWNHRLLLDDRFTNQHPYWITHRDMYMTNYSFDIDIIKTATGYIVFADIPSTSKNNILVNVENERLTITVNRDNNRNDSEGEYIMIERRYGRFSRSVKLDGAVNNGVVAKYTNGVLKIDIPWSGNSNLGSVVEIQ